MTKFYDKSNSWKLNKGQRCWNKNIHDDDDSLDNNRTCLFPGKDKGCLCEPVGGLKRYIRHCQDGRLTSSIMASFGGTSLWSVKYMIYSFITVTFISSVLPKWKIYLPSFERARHTVLYKCHAMTIDITQNTCLALLVTVDSDVMIC